jgi:8-oxo-dGTP diphosphatase
MPDRFKLIAEVYLLFRRGDAFLLSLRANTGYCDGQYGLGPIYIQDSQR